MASASFDTTVGIWERTGKNGNGDGVGRGVIDSDDDEDGVMGEEWENVGSLEGL